jgi:8-oxo-dGTP diphosphatase
MPEVVGAVLVKNNKVILTKRSSKCKYYPNKFEFPGGKVEMGEDLKEALVRELKE